MKQVLGENPQMNTDNRKDALVTNMMGRPASKARNW
jgi:hypothetical protein